MTHSRATISAMLESHGLAPSRALGQNFVTDPNTVRRIARLASVGPGDRVLEIGAGLGSLTLALAETGATVTAIEVDRHLIEPLSEVLAGTGVRLERVDAMTADYDELLGAEPVTVVANLPYNISTPLVLHLLEDVEQVKRMVVMVQLEVAERLAASPGDEAYGAVSVRVDYFAEARLVGKVPATVFLPRPNVESALVEIVRRDAPAIDPARVSADAIFTVVRTAFAQRRKMLRRSLAGVISPEQFERAGVDATRRPEELSLEEFARLAESR